MSFKPDILETPLYKSKPIVSKHYNKVSEVSVGNTFDNMEALDLAVRMKALDLAVRMKALEEGYQFLSNKTDPNRKNQGTVTRIKTNEKGVFEMLFIAFGASVNTYVHALSSPFAYNRHSAFKGSIQRYGFGSCWDGWNNQILPVAFGICKGETGPCWLWWMFVLKECIGDSPNLLFISDRHAAIALAVRNEFPLAFHDDVQLDAYHKLCQADPQRWSRAHCLLVHYIYMTSNSVKSVNACTVLNRKLPVIVLAETYRAMVQDCFFKRRELAANMKNEITDWVADKMGDIIVKSTLSLAHVNVANGNYQGYLVVML
ncbi:transposase, MuDR, MULE transposase domain protein [Tanacetum coccineum]